MLQAPPPPRIPRAPPPENGAKAADSSCADPTSGRISTKRFLAWSSCYCRIGRSASRSFATAFFAPRRASAAASPPLRTCSFCVQNPFPLPRFSPTARALMLRKSPVQLHLLIYLSGLTCVFIRNTMPIDQCSRKDLRSMLLLRLFSEGTAMRIFQESTLPPQACHSDAVASFGRRGSVELLPTCCSLL